MKKFCQFALAVAGVVFVSCGVASAQWGDLKMKFVIDGTAPKMAPLKVDKDPAVCGKKPLLEESFVVGKDGAVQNVVVYLVPKGTVKIHPSYDEVKDAKVVIDNKNCAFVPHIALLRTGQTLVCKNSDPVGHNSQLNFSINQPQNPSLPPMSELPIKPADIAKAEKRATSVKCSIHPWMQAWLVVQDHPYMAASDEAGVVEIKNLPVGKHSFQFWQERDGYPALSGGKLKLVKGKADIEIKEGANDLGEIKIKPKAE